jgi:hypothetical protein
MRRLLIGVGLVVSLAGAGMAVAQETNPEAPDTGGSAGNCATPFASPDMIASPDRPDLALASTPAVEFASPEASPNSLDCATPLS